MSLDPVVIVGAGPAGAAAALELARNGVQVVILEAEDRVGGLSRTLEFRGARFDIGPHRFFTNDAQVNELWRDTLGESFIDVPRLTRIYYRHKLFNYPISIGDTLSKVGPLAAARFGASYISARCARALSREEPDTFEQWVVAQFGRSLFDAFFRTYTEKVWGIPCSQIGAEWAAQRIKGLSLSAALRNALFKSSVKAKTLTDRFSYPRLGAGMMYEAMIEQAETLGARLMLKTMATTIRHENGRAVAVGTDAGGVRDEIPCSCVLLSNPITHAVAALEPEPAQSVLDAAGSLRYRSHVCVNLLVEGETFPDNWIYVHDTDVQLARVANHANFSSQMRDAAGRSPISVEYFQFADDPLYTTPCDQKLIDHATGELAQMAIVNPQQVVDGFVIRSEYAYPVIELGYATRLERLRACLSAIENIQPIGRGGMFKYNNQDHSIATGLLAARNILGEDHDVWAVNTDPDYHESA